MNPLPLDTPSSEHVNNIARLWLLSCFFDKHGFPYEIVTNHIIPFVLHLCTIKTWNRRLKFRANIQTVNFYYTPILEILKRSEYALFFLHNDMELVICSSIKSAIAQPLRCRLFLKKNQWATQRVYVITDKTTFYTLPVYIESNK